MNLHFFFHRVTDVRPCHLFQRSCIGARSVVPEIPLGMRPWRNRRGPAARGISDRLAYPLFFDGNFGVADLGGAAPSSQRTLALAAFAIQLLLNAVWSPIFFGNHNLLAGLIVILLLVVAIAVTIATAS